MRKTDFDEIVRSLRESGSELDGVEAKEAHKGSPSRLWESISALANRTGGGTIIFGLAPVTFEAVGVFNIDELQRAVASQCSEMMPPVRPDITAFSEAGKGLLCVTIPECPREHKPCFHKASGISAGSFIRVGDGDRRMTDYEVHSLVVERGQPEEDRRIVEAPIAALQRTKIEEFFAALRAKQPNARHLQHATIEELMVRYGIAKLTDTGIRPTVAGLLMFGEYPQEFFPNLCVTVLRYAGPRNTAAIDADDILENQKLEGTIPEMLEGALGVLRRNMRRGTLKSGLLAEDIWEYPETALREVLVNAVAHRDYGSWAVGTQVQIKMFSDALVVQNPGGLYGPVSEDTLDDIDIQAARNVHLMKLLELTGLVENRGSGIRTIIAQLSRAGLPPPQFRDGRTYFRAEFLNESLLDSQTIEWLNRFSDQPINERQRRALAYLRRVRSIQNRDYSRLNNCDSRVATADLVELRGMGLLRQVGTRGKSVYFLSEAHRPEAARIPGGVKGRHSVILGYMRDQGERPVSASEIASALKMKPVTTRWALRELVAAGILERTEKSLHSKRQAYRIRSSAT